MSATVRDRPATPPQATPSPARREPSHPLVLVLHFLNVEEGWLSFLGLILAAEAMAGSVAAAYWQPGLTGLPMLVGLAMGLGYVLTRMWLPRLPAHALALLLGFIASAHMLAGSFLPFSGRWSAEVLAISVRLLGWIEKAAAGDISQDDLLIALAVAMFVFAWAYLAYWVGLRLRAGWIAAGLLGAVIVANVQLKPAAAAPQLALWASGSLLLNLGLALFRRRHVYRRLRFAAWRPGQRLSLTAGLTFAGISTLAFAAAPPVQVNKQLNDLWNRLNGPIGQAQRFYQNIGVPRQYDPSEIRGGGFQPQLRFLGPFRPGDELTMKVRSDRPRYEQGVVYDHYDHNGWTNTRFDQFESTTSEYSTLTALRDTSHDRDRKQIAQEIVQVRPMGALLFAAPQPLGTSIKLRGDGFGDLRATTTIQPNEVYTAASLESLATAESLAAASGPAPPDVRASFLQLPPDLPGRITELAEQQTAGRRTPFDKAVALESYLRTFPYDTETPPPPAGRDGVDWFLFDLHRGYCDYISSAMAVMLRTLGIPARVVSGYSPGTLDPGDGYYHVTERQTHTWTQAYFPGYGWIDFEPSGVNPPFPRAHSPRSSAAGGAAQPTPTLGPSATPTSGPGPGSPANNNRGSGAGTTRPSGSWPWPLLLLLAVLGVTAYVVARQRGTPGARLAYARLTLLGALLGLRAHRWQTPQEFGRELRARRGLDGAATDTITRLYSADRYGGRTLPEPEHRRAWAAWQRVKAGILKPWARR